MHRERICIYSRIKDSRDAAAAAAFFFLSGPIMHRRPSNGCSSDWRSAVQLFPVRSGSNTVLGDAAWTRGNSPVSQVNVYFIGTFCTFCGFKGGGVGFKKGACPRKHPTTFLPIVSSSVNHPRENEQKEKKKDEERNKKIHSRWKKTILPGDKMGAFPLKQQHLLCVHTQVHAFKCMWMGTQQPKRIWCLQGLSTKKKKKRKMLPNFYTVRCPPRAQLGCAQHSQLMRLHLFNPTASVKEVSKTFVLYKYRTRGRVPQQSTNPSPFSMKLHACHAPTMLTKWCKACASRMAQSVRWPRCFHKGHEKTMGAISFKPSSNEIVSIWLALSGHMARVSLGERNPLAPAAEVLILSGSSALPLGKDAPSGQWLGFRDPYSRGFFLRLYTSMPACARRMWESQKKQEWRAHKRGAVYPSLHHWSKQGPRFITDCSLEWSWSDANPKELCTCMHSIDGQLRNSRAQSSRTFRDGACGGSLCRLGSLMVLDKRFAGRESVRACACVCWWKGWRGEGWREVGGSQAVAVAVSERRFGQFHHVSSPLADDFGGTTQQLLGLGECFGEFFLPLYELWVALWEEEEH